MLSVITVPPFVKGLDVQAVLVLLPGRSGLAGSRQSPDPLILQFGDVIQFLRGQFKSGNGLLDLEVLFQRKLTFLYHLLWSLFKTELIEGSSVSLDVLARLGDGAEL